MSILPPEQPSSSSKPLYIRKKSAAKTKDKEPVRPHVKASLEDINWVRSQPPCVQQLWLDCVAVEQFGGQQREVKTSLSRNAFSKAKSALEGKGLFKFEQMYAPAKSGRGFVVGWKVENLHGYYKKNYWELDAHEVTAQSQIMTAESQTVITQSQIVTAESHEKTPDSQIVCNTIPETHSMTKPVSNQPLFNYPSTTPQPPTKVVEEGSREGSIAQETHQTPLGGAGATNGAMPEEEKEVSPDSSALVPDKSEEPREESASLGGDECSGGDIATQPNSDVCETEDADDDIVVGHADIVEVICQRVGEYYYCVTEVEREQMMQLTISQLQVLSERFHHQMNQRTTIPSREKVQAVFNFSLGVARYAAPV